MESVIRQGALLVQVNSTAGPVEIVSGADVKNQGHYKKTGMIL